MRITNLVLPLLLFTTSVANATGEVYCQAVDGSEAKFGYGFGRVPGLAIVSATIHANGRTWSLHEAENADRIIVAQGARDGPQTVIDFADPEYTQIIASVRIISAFEKNNFRSVALLRISETGVYAMICE